jgi:DNA-binding LytR/AlgR family response regulator
MINIAIYKEGVNLKSEFVDRPLSIAEKHTLFFCAKYEMILNLVKNDQADIIMYFTDQLQDTDRDNLKRIVEISPSTKLILYSDAAHALQAWKMDMFHFDDHPIDLDKVKRSFNKYVRTIQIESHNVLSLRLSDGTHNIPFKDIRFLLASGNYTFIHYESDKNLLITKQIGQFDFLSEKNRFFQRIHRSLILNMSTIKSVEDQQVYFFNCQKPLDVSASLAQKIKKILATL